MTPEYVIKLAVPTVIDEKWLRLILHNVVPSAADVHNENSDDIWSACTYLFTGVYVMPCIRGDIACLIIFAMVVDQSLQQILKYKTLYWIVQLAGINEYNEPS